MRKLFYFITLSLSIMIWCSCNENTQFRERLKVLDAILVKHPDSVFSILQGMSDEAKQQPHAVQMYYELIKADAQNKAYIDFTTDSVMTIVAKYYDAHGTPNEKMRAYYLLGCTYRDLKDVPKELQCFLDATERADTSAVDCDLYTLYAIFGQMADIYYKQHLPLEELKALKICEDIATEDNDTFSAIKAYELRLRSYHTLKMPDSVLKVSETARKRYLAANYRQEAARLLSPATTIMLDRKEYDKAYEYIQIFKNESGYFTGDEITTPRAYIFYRSLGRYALHCGKLDSARYYFDKLIEKNQKEAAYQGLMYLYQKTGQTDSIVKYSKLYADANDSSHIGNNAESLAQITAMFNYGREKHEAEKAKEQLLVEKGKSMTFIVIIFCLILSVLLILYYMNRVRKNNIKRIIELNREIEHKTILLNEARENNDDNYEKYSKLKESLDNALMELKKYKKKDMLAAFFESDIYRLFKRMSLKGNDMVTIEEWDNMSRVYNTTFSSYVDYIHSCCSMTPDQEKVAMLIRMGFGETEMANIMSVDLKRISRIKMQINQKIFNSPSAKDLVPNLKKHF